MRGECGEKNGPLFEQVRREVGARVTVSSPQATNIFATKQSCTRRALLYVLLFQPSSPHSHQISICVMTLTSGPSLFHVICEQAGLALGSNGAPNALHTESSRFQRELSRLIQWGTSGSDCVDLFLEGLQDHLEDTENLRICLMPILNSRDMSSKYVHKKSLGLCQRYRRVWNATNIDRLHYRDVLGRQMKA
jgi:hypothetical protein